LEGGDDGGTCRADTKGRPFCPYIATFCHKNDLKTSHGTEKGKRMEGKRGVKACSARLHGKRGEDTNRDKEEGED